MSTRELISLQTGSLTNHVCVHFWNLQEAYLLETINNESPFLNHVLFNTNARNENVRPRLLVVDSSDTVDFGISVNANCIPCSALWEGSLTEIFRVSAKPSENTKASWLKCLSPQILDVWRKNEIIQKLNCRLEPIENSRDYLTNSQHPVDPNIQLSSFSQGLDVLRPGSRTADEFEDHVRQLAESCSRPDGFQLFMDAEDGFTGVASRQIEHLCEEFPKRSMFFLPIYNSLAVSLMSRKHRLMVMANQLYLLNIFESSNELCTHSIWLPTDLAKFKSFENPCIANGLLASTLDTATTPLRTTYQFGGRNLDEFVNQINSTSARKMISATVYLSPQDDDDAMSSYTLNPYSNLSDNQTYLVPVRRCKPILSRQVVTRGLPIERLWSYLTETKSNRTTNLFKCCLPSHPLKISNHKDFSSVRYCQQFPTTYALGILDTPSENCVEFRKISKLVHELKLHKSRPPDISIEVDLWNELLESSERILTDT